MQRIGRRFSVAQVMAGASFGGLESVVRMLCSGLTARGHQVAVIAVLDSSLDPNPLASILEQAGAEVHPLHIAARDYLGERRELRRSLRALAPDLIHCHGYRADIQAGAAARRLGLPVTSTVHGFTGGNWKMAVYEWLQLRSLRRNDRVIAVSGPIVERLHAAGIAADRVTLLRNAWSNRGLLLPRGEARRQLGLPGDTTVLGWVGRLSFEKGVDLLIRALPLLAHSATQLCLVGEGPERTRLEEASRRLGVEDRVVFAGAHLNAERLFGAFDVYVLPSRTEGTPIVLFEAMEAGVPIVSTSVGGVPDVLGEEAGVLVAPERLEDLAEAIDSVLGDADGARARCVHARHRLAEAFSLEPWLEAHERHYAQLAS